MGPLKLCFKNVSSSHQEVDQTHSDRLLAYGNTDSSVLNNYSTRLLVRKKVVSRERERDLLHSGEMLRKWMSEMTADKNTSTIKLNFYLMTRLWLRSVRFIHRNHVVTFIKRLSAPFFSISKGDSGHNIMRKKKTSDCRISNLFGELKEYSLN